MTIEFDDLIPNQKKGIEFDDLIPKSKPQPTASWSDNLKDIAIASGKILPVAIKGVADIGRLATGDRIGTDTSNTIKTYLENVDRRFGSDALNAQKANINRALQDNNIGISDIPSVAMDNPKAALDAAITTVGSMFLPTGMAVGATKMLPAATKVLPSLARVTPGAAATGASVVTGAAQNAAETFADTAGQDMADRYKGAGISGAASLVLGKLLGGGAEGVVARRMTGETGVRGALAMGKSAAATGGKEFLQEGGEESSNYLGKQVAKNEAIDPNTMGKQGLYGGMIGLGVGGMSDVATNLANVGKGSAESQIADAINQAAQDFADRTPPQTVQQTVARIFDRMPERQAFQPAPQPAPDLLALGFDPAVRNPQPTMVADTIGNVRVMSPDEQLAQQELADRLTSIGLTPDVQRAIYMRQQAPEPGPIPPLSSDLIQRLLGTGWQPPTAPTPAVTPAPVSQPKADIQPQPAPAQAPAITAQPNERYGVDHTPFSAGGKPFKSKLSATKAKKLQPTMRVIKVDGGFALADKTPAQLAAEAKAAKRIRGASTGNTGAPMSVHEFIAAEGGLSRSVQSDLGIEGNVKIGNRWLYAGPGKGMTIEQAAEKLKEAGYINDELHNTAYDIIRRSINNPQYTAEGWEQVAESERKAQFEDYLAAQQEAAQADDFDPFDPLADAGFLENDSDGTGFWEANQELQAEVYALAAQLEAMGFEPYDVLDPIVRANPNATQDQYNEIAKQALTEAIAQATQPAGNRDTGQDDGEQGQARGQTEAQPKEEVLTSGQDWMAELFGNVPEQQTPQQTQITTSPRRDKAALIAVLADAKREAEASREDWDSRTYKGSRKQVDLRGDGPSRQESMSVSAINEGRRKKNIEALNQEIAAIERMERMLTNEQSANRLLDILQTTMEAAERSVQDGTAIVGKTPAEAFEYNILQRLDIKPAQGAFTSNRVSKALLQYLQGQQQEAQTEGLTSYTPQEIEDRLANLEQAEQERKKQDRKAEQRAKADAERDTFTLTGSDRPADVAAANGQQDIFSAPAKAADAELKSKAKQQAEPEVLTSPTPDDIRTQEAAKEKAKADKAKKDREDEQRAPRKQTTDSKIEDFGEKIGGARKDVWKSFKDQLGEIADDDIASHPLSKIWPQPDYQALLDNGADPWTVAFARAARDEIPSKPRQAWKIHRWVEQVRSLRDATMKLMDGSLSVERAKQLMTQFSSQGMRDLAGRVELYTLVGHSKSLDGVRIRSGEYSTYNQVEYNPPKVIWTVEKEAAATAFSNWPRKLASGATREEALKAFKKEYDSLDINPAAKKEVTFDIYSKRGQDGYFIGKKVGRNYIDLAGPFENVKAAREHKATKQAELVAKLEKSKEIPQERRDTNEPRVGEDMRNGQDVTPQMFGETFGFRGVEFGNWVEQGRRQKDLNDAFDALMDMAAVLDIPPKAISLNGELGIAFGARGSGGKNPAKAHYESSYVVINMTKKSGAGSLGHEWWHALDNYFSRMRAKSDDMMTDALDVLLASRGSKFIHQGAVRKEMIEAFGAVMKAIRETAIKARSEKLDAKRSKEYWTTDPEMSARAFESYLISKLQDQNASNDYLANIVDPETWKAAEALGFELDDSYPYPTAGEIPAIRAGFDHFFQTVQTRETDKGVMLFDIPQLQDAGPINRLPDAARANVLAKLKALENRITDGKISETEYRSGVQALIEQIEQRNETRLYRSIVKGRERGPDWITERLIRAKRKGELDAETVNFALWALSKNPALAEDLGISVRESNEAGTAGDYNPTSQIMRLFKGSANTATAVHEILHHTERMMPTDVQNGILKEYGRAWDKAYQKSDEKTRESMRDMLLAQAGDNEARFRVLQAFRDGTLKYDQHYQLFNASEFWAVNATDIMANRYGAQGSWIAQAKRWLTEMMQYIKGALGLRSDAPILRGLESVLNGTGKRISKDMLVGRDDMLEDINANGIQSAANTWTVLEPGTMDNAIRAIQNNKIDMKRVRDSIQERFGKINDNADAYLNEELYHGKVAARVEAIYQDRVEPILAKIAVAGKNAGVTMDDVNQYLHARHAPERNAAMKAINPDMKNNEALSGMSNQEAAKVMADFTAAGKDKALALIARDVDQLLTDTRTNLVADGLEDAGVVSAWESAYKHYVPLQRDIGSSGTPKGMGFSVRGPESKRAVGSNKEVVNILANIVAQAETAAIRAEKATVGRSLLAMARQYPNPDFWTVDKAPTKPRINKDTGLVERNAVDPLYQTADNVIMVKDYGQEHFIVFNQKNERAVAVAKAMKNLDIAPMNKVLQVVNTATKFMAMLLTARNPEFWLTNFSRDIQGALINLDSTEAEGMQARMLANLPLAFKGMHAVVRGGTNSQWARYAKELQEAGGTTGYIQSFENSDKRMADLQKQIDRMQQGKADPRRLARLALEFLDDYNDIIENAVRLSAFQAARQAGVSTARAASIAKNITVNFNRKGNLTPTVNALYMFFNASVQGTARLVQAVATSRRTQAVVGSIAVLGFVMDLVNRMMAGDDEETRRNRYDLIPEYEKSRNWIFMNPMRPGEYVKVPLPLGPHIFHNAGRLLSDAMNRKDKRNASEYGWSMAGIFLDAFSPLGASQSVGQLIAPSILDPVVQVAENKSFTGGPVYKAADKGFGKTDPKPAYTRHFENTPDVWVGASKALNDLTGGDKVKPGLVNIEPDIFKHVFYTLTGGPGRALDRMVDTAQAPAHGREFTVNRVPIVSRFYGENDDAQRERAYYDDRKRAGDAKTQFDYYVKQGRMDLAKEVAKELGNGDEAKGRKKMLEFSRAEKSVRKINSEIRRELERDDDGDAKAEQLKALRQRRVRVMSDALDDEE